MQFPHGSATVQCSIPAIVDFAIRPHFTRVAGNTAFTKTGRNGVGYDE